MAKENKFESLDHYKLNDCWNEFRNYHDSCDSVLKDKQLKNFVCKLPLNKNQRRALIKAINTPAV